MADWWSLKESNITALTTDGHPISSNTYTKSTFFQDILFYYWTNLTRRSFFCDAPPPKKIHFLVIWIFFFLSSENSHSETFRNTSTIILRLYLFIDFLMQMLSADPHLHFSSSSSLYLDLNHCVQDIFSDSCYGKLMQQVWTFLNWSYLVMLSMT